MKKALVLLTVTSCLGSQAFAASATSYQCSTSVDSYAFGESFTAVVTRTLEASSIKISGTEQGDIEGDQDVKYKPRAKNVGSVRYDVSIPSGENIGTGCGGAQVTLDKSLAQGGDGELTFIYDCDSDGSGPSFFTYQCQQ